MITKFRIRTADMIRIALHLLSQFTPYNCGTIVVLVLVQETTKCGESSDIIIMSQLGGGVNLDNYRSIMQWQKCTYFCQKLTSVLMSAS